MQLIIRIILIFILSISISSADEIFVSLQYITFLELELTLSRNFQNKKLHKVLKLFSWHNHNL